MKTENKVCGKLRCYEHGYSDEAVPCDKVRGADKVQRELNSAFYQQIRSNIKRKKSDES